MIRGAVRSKAAARLPKLLIEADYCQKSIMHGTTTTQFNCANCNALYHLIKVEAASETVERELNCQACGAPLPARDGQFVLKYFLLRKPSGR
jgi:hypothetical protein